MIKEKQIRFYKAVGKCLTDTRKRRNMTVAHLAQISGEQHKTIKSIEEGRPLSMHHAVWMKKILGIDINKIIENMEGDENGKGKSESTEGSDDDIFGGLI